MFVNRINITVWLSAKKLSVSTDTIEFPESKPCLPTKITVEAFPWKTQVVIQPK